MKKLTELEMAESLLIEILSFRQNGAPAGTSPKNLQKALDIKVEHFLRRDEEESGYYDYFHPMPKEAKEAEREMRAAAEAVDEALAECQIDI
jgi:hypothetical protein